MPGNLAKIDLREAPRFFEKFYGRYLRHFKTKTRSVGNKAKDYMLGGLHLDRKATLTNMPKVVSGADSQNLQHFITDSPWKKEPVITQLQKDANDLIGGEDSALIVDGSAFSKQGEKSVGVKRQWCGNLGEVENCQVGVFLGLADSEGGRTLINERLYLPEEWTEDEERRKKAGVPENVEFRKKPELALDMILGAKENGVSFGWVNADSLYGRSSDFRGRLDEEDITYVVDVPSDTNVRLVGEAASLEEEEEPPQKVDELAAGLDSSRMEEVYVRDTERGNLSPRLLLSEFTPLRTKTFRTMKNG